MRNVSKPTNYQVRQMQRELKDLREAGEPLPTPDEIRRQLGWHMLPNTNTNKRDTDR
jgi:hypothetical protein